MEISTHHTQASGQDRQTSTQMTLTMASPVGRLRLVAVADALVAIDFLSEDRTIADDQMSAPSAVLAAAARQLDAYFAGGLREFDVPHLLTGTSFQIAVWEALRTIPYGSTISYGELARRTGRAGAARAVGRANGQNPLPIIVPCHRVIGAGGGLTGYGGGLGIKAALLELESSQGRLSIAGSAGEMTPAPLEGLGRPAHQARI
jgi:methylated-DNA-[protein]-cysteine S-methyltransferase